MNPAALRALVSGEIENFVAAATPGGIEAQEKQGQTDFAGQQTLPKKSPRLDLEALGFVFGEDADDIFVNVTFPVGWSKRPTAHSMWSDLLDDKGRERGNIFYKAAFYDRSAHMYLVTRFSYKTGYLPNEAVEIQVLDRANNEVVWCSESCESGNYDKRDGLVEQARVWLQENHSDWQSPAAYW